MEIDNRIFIIFLLGILMITLGFYFMYKDTIKESNCYNLTPYEFYRNESCKRYINEKK